MSAHAKKRKVGSAEYSGEHVEKCKKLTDAKSERTSEALLAKLQKQQGFFYIFFYFYQASQILGAANLTNFVISHKIAKIGQPFSPKIGG